LRWCYTNDNKYGLDMDKFRKLIKMEYCGNVCNEVCNSSRRCGGDYYKDSIDATVFVTKFATVIANGSQQHSQQRFDVNLYAVSG